MNKIKKSTKVVLAAGLCTALTMNAAMPVSASEAAIEKDENVYAALAQDGTVSGIYVINEFSSQDGGEISDYGDYISVENLTDESEIIVEDGHITADMSKGKFYYQGNLESLELPWDVAIKYFLDGKEMDADEVAGKSGAMKILIQTKQNPDSQQAFFDHYLLQATVVLNTEKCSDIQAEGATAGNVGVNRQLVYTLLPGEEAEIEITAQVQDFEMDGITFQGVPLALGVSEGMLDEVDLSGQTEELADAVALLDDGVGALKEGTEAAAEGGSQLAAGIGQLADGANALNSGGSSLTLGSSALLSGTKVLQAGVSQYTDGVNELAGGIQQYVAGVELLAQGGKQLEPLENLAQVDDAVVSLYQAVAVGDTLSGVPSLQAGAGSLSDGLDIILAQVKQLENTADGKKLQELLEVITQMQTLTESLAETAGNIGGSIAGSAEVVRSVSASHQAVLDGINSQIGTANSSISGTVNRVNAQIDNAVSSIQAAVQAGTLDEAAANQTIASLQAAKISQEAVPAVQMPQENAEIQAAIASLDQAAEQLNSSAEEFSGASMQLAATAEGIRTNLSSESGSNGIAGLSEGLSAACAGADQLEEGVTQIGAALGALKEITAYFGDAGDGIAALNSGFYMLTDKNDALMSGSEMLISAGGELNESMQSLASGTGELNSGAGILANGINTLHSGVSLLNANTGTLTSGLAALNEGTGQLKDGTQQFREETDNIDETIREKMEEMLDELSGDDFQPVSFVSEENTNIGLVQFAITAEGVKIQEEAEEAEPEKEEGFADRLMGLFGLQKSN